MALRPRRLVVEPAVGLVVLVVAPFMFWLSPRLADGVACVVIGGAGVLSGFLLCAGRNRRRKSAQ